LNRQKFEELIQENRRKLFQDLRENTKEIERTNKSRSYGKINRRFFNMITPEPALVLPLQQR
jgi:hypothetical protein